MCIANVFTEWRWKAKRKMILPDFGFDFANNVTPFLTTWVKYPDIAVTVIIIIFVVWLLLDGPKLQKIAVFRRFILMSGLLYFGRAICLVGTQLPSPFYSNDSFYDNTWNGNIFIEAFEVLLRLKATNTDVFYSGHTIDITLIALAIQTYSHRKWFIIIIWFYAIFSLYVIIATKFHYSIDVLIAFILALLLWKLYHMTMRIKSMRNHLPLFKYFESDKEMLIYTASNTTISNIYSNYKDSILTNTATEDKEYIETSLEPRNNVIFTPQSTKSVSSLDYLP